MFPMAFDRQTLASLALPGDEHETPVLQKPLDRTGHMLWPVAGATLT